MARTLTALATVLVLAACAARPPVAVRQAVSVCPAEPPALACPVWPAGAPATLADLFVAVQSGRAAHAQCRALAEAWAGAHRACQRKFEGGAP